MQSHDALKMAVGGSAVQMAKRLSLSSSLVHKWCEPSSDFTDSGALNPLDRVEVIVETALREGRTTQEAFAPIFYLSDRFGGLFLPPVPRTIETHDFSRQLCRAVKEAGEAFNVAAAALEDDKLTPNERRKIAREMYEAIAALSEFVRMIEAK